MEAGDFVTGCFADFIEDLRLCPYSFAYEKNKQFRNNGQSAKLVQILGMDGVSNWQIIFIS